MKNPGLPERLWAALDGGLWHATGSDGLKGILADGEIRIVGDRYRNSFCRHMGCVALLDFGPSAVDGWGQFKNWSGWFGRQQQARVAVWLKIDRRAAAAKVIDAGTLHEKWKNNHSKQIIPGVEAGHSGPVPVGCIEAVLLIYRYEWSTFELLEGLGDGTQRSLRDFKRSLPPAPDPHPIVAAIEARRKHQRTE